MLLVMPDPPHEAGARCLKVLVSFRLSFPHFVVSVINSIHAFSSLSPHHCYFVVVQMCSLQRLSASLNVTSTHECDCVCVCESVCESWCVKEGQASCQDVGSSRGTVALGQKSQLSAETQCVRVSVCVCVSLWCVHSCAMVQVQIALTTERA